VDTYSDIIDEQYVTEPVIETSHSGLKRVESDIMLDIELEIY
jgi:hypothetical protein